jgi:hypothetical protein
VKDEVEFLVRKDRKVAHIAQQDLHRKPLAIRDRPVAFKLFRRIVEDGHLCAGCGQDRPLLTTA